MPSRSLRPAATAHADAKTAEAVNAHQLVDLVANAGPSLTVSLHSKQLYSLNATFPRIEVPANSSVQVNCNGATIVECASCYGPSYTFYRAAANSRLAFDGCVFNTTTMVLHPSLVAPVPGAASPAGFAAQGAALPNDPLAKNASMSITSSTVNEPNCWFVSFPPPLQGGPFWVGVHNATQLNIILYSPILKAPNTSIVFHSVDVTCPLGASLYPPQPPLPAPVLPTVIVPSASPDSHGSGTSFVGWPLVVLLCGLALLVALFTAVLWAIRRRRDGAGRSIKLGEAHPSAPLAMSSRGDGVHSGSYLLAKKAASDKDGKGRVWIEVSAAPSWSGSQTDDNTDSTTGSRPQQRLAQAQISSAVQALQEEFNNEQLRVHNVIAQGGFGVVYTGTWRGLSVAVKTVLFQGVSAGNASMKRAAAEASIAYNLAHANVVVTYAYELKPMADSAVTELNSWKLYLVQELCNGGNLTSLIESRALRGSSDRTRLNRILPILLDIARGMSHVHSKKIAHGDLNPNNILLTVKQFEGSLEDGNWRAGTRVVADAIDGGRCTAKISDFGLSIRLDSMSSHVSNIRQGTPFYTAPELASQHRLLQASDVYSFGVMIWSLAHGSHPFQLRDGIYVRHPDFGTFSPGTPFNLALLAIACMARDPRQRPTFPEIEQVLGDINDDVCSGTYIDARGDQVTDWQPADADLRAVPEPDPADAAPSKLQSAATHASWENVSGAHPPAPELPPTLDLSIGSGSTVTATSSANSASAAQPLLPTRPSSGFVSADSSGDGASGLSLQHPPPFGALPADAHRGTHPLLHGRGLALPRAARLRPSGSPGQRPRALHAFSGGGDHGAGFPELQTNLPWARGELDRAVEGPRDAVMPEELLAGGAPQDGAPLRSMRSARAPISLPSVLELPFESALSENDAADCERAYSAAGPARLAGTWDRVGVRGGGVRGGAAPLHNDDYDDDDDDDVMEAPAPSGARSVSPTTSDLPEAGAV